VICAAAVLMTAGFLLFRYLPLRKAIKEIEQTEAAQKLAIGKALGQKNQLSSLKLQLEQLKEKVGNFKASVPANRDAGAFLHKITNLMSQHNLSEAHIERSRGVEADQLHCIPINMQCKGPLEQIFEFFSSLQALERSVRIEQIKLVNDDQFSGEVTMQTDAVIYYRTEAGQG
jgi:Tfp pilus assembly protein PilO